MSIQNNINEINSIDTEIKRITGELKKLRQRKKELEKNIIKFLEEKEQPGVKFGKQALFLEKKTKKVNKKNKQYDQDTLKILKANGIEDPEKVLKEIKEAKIIKNEEQTKLKMTEI